ncbi:fimbria/pilus outer membrane usher protein [Escherichia coli]|uniref:fimbria/pilus outer membrane usher protein n=1 Tax=Escherichia coli TaxID=562 RepID=UPI0033158E83
MTIIPLALLQNSYAREVFNYKLLETGASESELEAIKNFDSNDGLVPGKYRVDIFMNNQRITRKDVEFIFDKKEDKLLPILTKKEYIAMGVAETPSDSFASLAAENIINNIKDYIPLSSVRFEQNSLRLFFSVPQVAMSNTANGFIDPVLWDDGIPALFTNYYFSGSHELQDNRSENSSYLNLNNGVNFGPWRLRNDINYNDGKWKNIDTYIWKNIPSLTSKITFGDTWTDSAIFDSFQFRGVKLESNENMLPFSMRGFAPVIRGVANSNAQVTVRQNNYIIYQNIVPPGPFEFHDITPVTSGSDMEITIKESDGSEHKYIQATASTPIMRREDAMSYSLTGGQYRSNNNNNDKPNFVQGTLIYGLPKGITVYGGTILATDYHSEALGAGFDLQQFGSLSADVTKSYSNKNNDDSQQGYSYRLQYSKNFSKTDTNVTLAGYRYSTKKYYTFDEAQNNYDEDEEDDLFSSQNNYSRHRRLQLTISQALPSIGQFNLSGYQQDYWGIGGKERSLSIGYNHSWESINFSINYLLTKMPDRNSNEQQLSLSVSLPLDKWLPGTHVNYNTTSSNSGHTLNSMSFNGSALEDKNLNYSIQQSHSEQGYGGNTSLNYRTSKGILGLGWNYGQEQHLVNYSAQGAVVLHPYGLTLSQSLGDSSVLIRAPDTSGLGVNKGTAIYTDWRGYSIVPYASAFQRNRIMINSQTLPLDVEIQEPVQEVIPTEGALVVANFSPQRGQRILLTLTHKGKFVPFGALVTYKDAQNSTLVGQNGEVYLSGAQVNQYWLVKWGKSSNESCQLYLSPDLFKNKPAASNLIIDSAKCD